MSASSFALRLLSLSAALLPALPAPAQTPREELPPIAMDLLPALGRAHDAGAADPDQVLHLAVSLPYARPEAMQAFVDSVNDPKSPDYQRFITPEEVGERFGPSQDQILQVVDYLEHNGFEITLVAKNRLAVLANATVARAEAAFHTTIREYTLVPQDEVEPSRFVANSTPVRLPVNLAALVIDVSGLETYTRPKHIVTLLTPALTRGLYDTVNMFNAGFQGQGRTIGISNWDGFRANNWLLYISHFGLPVPAGGAGSNIAVVPCGGGGAGAGTAQGEGDLDIQMELGMAPLASIKVYDGTSSGNLIAVLTQEVNDNLADVISESWGWNIGSSTANAAHNQHLSMSAQGITYMAASGDSGTSLEPYSYPDYEPEVLSIGGTVANVNASSGARISEVGWSGSGGGWSTNGAAFNVRPSWQTGTGVLPLNATTNHRLVPDIGFHAAGNGTGAYQFYFNNALHGDYIGTSFASPIYAGMLGIVEQKLISLGGLPPNAQGKRRFGRMQDLIYGQNGRSDVWHDITSGGNGNRPDGSASTCTAFWDTVTGWGPMDCEVFANLLGCGADADGDGTPDCTDGCPNDPAKIAPGQCGCGVPDTDSDGDGTANCHDGCPNDPAKIAPGQCGCGVPDTDSDGDGTANCVDGCPNDPNKIAPGICGCGVPDTDSDGDGTPNCNDGCPNDPAKTSPGQCGCGVADTDSDGDGTPDCHDGCPNDPLKTAPGQCGCGVADTDSDGDGTANCNDGCPNDPAKTVPGQCGCGVADLDADGDGVADCVDNCPAIPNPTQSDCDGDGVGDACALAAGAPDCNGNGIPDTCDIASGTSQDTNGNGIPDTCEQTGTPYCFGDGTGAPCPCGNSGAPGHGCANSIGHSAQASAVGTTTPDTIVISATGEMPTALTIVMQGSASIAPAMFGDGLRCVGGTLKRLYALNATAGVVYAPHPGDLSISARSAALGDTIPPGGTRYYMTYYRDANAVFCPAPPGGTFNASNAITIVW